jgi:polyphosphate kinase
LDEVLGSYLKDNLKARRLLVDGKYSTVEAKGPSFRSQLFLLEAARRSAETKVQPVLRHLAAPEIPSEPMRGPAAPAAPVRATGG